MATRPPKRVSASSGQGVSRKSYQTGYSLGMHGTGTADAPRPVPITRATPATGGGGQASMKRDYGKTGKSSPMNIQYSEREMPLPTLDDLKAVGKRKAPRAGKGFL